MKSEMGYKFRGAGHEEPEGKRKYKEPDRTLEKIFVEWIKGLPPMSAGIEDFYEECRRQYEVAVKIFEKHNFSQDEGHALFCKYQDYPQIQYAGHFLSAFYNHLPDKEIIFDIDMAIPSYFIAYRLKEGKLFINKGTTGLLTGQESASPVINFGKIGVQSGTNATAPLINYGECAVLSGADSKSAVINYGKAELRMGQDAQGPVINMGEAERFMGCGAEGPVINFNVTKEKLAFGGKQIVINAGTCGEDFGASHTGILIALREPASFNIEDKFGFGKPKLLLRERDCTPELVNYVEHLRQLFEKGRTDYRAALAALDEFGKEPGRKIESDIEDILRRNGHNV